MAKGKTSVTITGVAISQKAKNILIEILEAAGLTSAKVTSGGRTPKDQARAMYQNLERPGGVASQKKLYGPSGDKVIAVYEQQKKANKTAPQILKAMEDKIKSIGPAKVSAHCSSTYEAFDVAFSSIKDKPKFEHALKEFKKNKKMRKYIKETSNRCYHIEVTR